MYARTRSKPLFFVLLVLLLCALGVSPAFAVGVTFSGNSPAAGSTSVANVSSVSAYAVDDTILKSSAIVVVDGTAYPVAISFPGGWDEEGYWYEDQTQGTIAKYLSAPLADGSHTATVTVSDYLNRTFNTSWGFAVAVPPVVNGQSPYNGATVQSTTVPISATVSDNSTVAAASMKIDGVTVPAVYDSGTRKLSYSATFADRTSHTVVVTATDGGGRTTTSTWSFSIYVPALPAFDSVTPASGAVITAPLTTVSGHATSGVAFNSGGTITLDGAPVTASFAYDTEYDPDWGEWYDVPTGANLAYTAPKALGDGTHTVTMSLTDSLGRIASNTRSFTVSIPPSVNGLVPSAYSILSTTTVPVVQAVLSDNDGIASATMSVDGSTVPAIYNAATGVLTYAPTGPYPDGTTHTVAVTATDVGGKSTVKTWSFQVKVPAPITFSSETPGSGTVVTSSTRTVSTYVVSGSDLSASPTMKLDGVTVPASMAYLQEYDPDWGEWYDVTTQGTVGHTAPSALADGPHTAEVTIGDGLGRVGTKTWSFTVAVKPTVSGFVPATGSVLNTTTVPVISAGITDNGSIVSASMTLDGASVPAVFSAATSKITYAPTAALADNATHTIAVTATDNAGNTTVQTSTFRIAVPARPVLSNPVPSANSTVTTSFKRVAVGASGAVDLRSDVTMKVDNVAVPATLSYDTAIDDEGYEYTVYSSGSLGYDFPSPIRDGSHAVTATVTDSLGRTTSSSWKFNVACPPTIVAVVPYSGSVLTTLTPLMKATLADNDGVASATMTLDNIVVPATLAADGTISYKPATKLMSGKLYTLRITAVDLGGRSTTTTSVFSIQAYADMDGSNCESCHPGSTAHGQANMYSCTGSDCHGAMGCFDCHNSANHQGVPAAPVHDGSVHVTTTNMTNCQSCHDPQLTREHGRYKDASGAQYTCLTCHATTARADVKTAIAASRKDCAACHPTTKSHAGAPTTEMLVGNCTSCHSVNAHDMKACTACHLTPRALSYDWFAKFQYAHESLGAPKPGVPLGTCAYNDCHVMGQGDTHGADRITQYINEGHTCGTCHSASYPSIPSHGGVTHQTTLSTDCGDCHNAKLTIEHNRPGLTCATCHGSTARTAVKNAIAAGDCRCDTCHDPSTRHSSLR